jgi:hypothetical protein
MEIIEAGNLPEKEKVYLKKGILGYRLVYPIKIDGKFNIVNLLVGGWANLFKLIFILFIIFGFIFIYYHDTKEMQKVVANPCEYCSSLDMQNVLGYRYSKLEKYAIINISEVIIK